MHYMNEPTVTLGTEVRRFRQQSNLTQEELADRLGITRESLSKIERDVTTRPSDAVLEGLERTIGLSVAYAYELIGIHHPRDSDSAGRMLLELAALPSHEQRLEAWARLPAVYRNAILRVMADLFQDTAGQLRELVEQPSDQPKNI